MASSSATKFCLKASLFPATTSVEGSVHERFDRELRDCERSNEDSSSCALCVKFRILLSDLSCVKYGNLITHFGDFLEHLRVKLHGVIRCVRENRETLDRDAQLTDVVILAGDVRTTL